MFNSTILDVVIGLVFCFASVALFVSSLNEFIASLLKLRHKTLLSGIQKLLNDPSGTGLVRTLYEHALVNPLALVLPSVAAVQGADEHAAQAEVAAAPPSTQVVKPVRPAWAKQLPAYIASKDFAHAIVDIVQNEPGKYASLKQAIEAEVTDPQLKQTLLGIAARAQGNVDKFSDGVANWFDNAMDRLSGSYKRQAQAITFGIGLVTALTLNIDAFYVLDQLWKRPSLSAAIQSPGGEQLIAALAASPPVADATGAAVDAGSLPGADGAPTRDTVTPQQMMKTLGTLPVGWGERTFPDWNAGSLAVWRFYLFFVMGILVTASSAVFGAPFWFDLLQRLIQIRGTGAKPATNREQEQPVQVPAAPQATP